MEVVGTAGLEQEENQYVRELRQVFYSCVHGEDGLLDMAGLGELCRTLQLQEHYSYVAGQILPRPDDKVPFDVFKTRFIQLLPEIIDISSADEGSIPEFSERSHGGSPRSGTRQGSPTGSAQLVDGTPCKPSNPIFSSTPVVNSIVPVRKCQNNSKSGTRDIKKSAAINGVVEANTVISNGVSENCYPAATMIVSRHQSHSLLHHPASPMRQIASTATPDGRNNNSRSGRRSLFELDFMSNPTESPGFPHQGPSRGLMELGELNGGANQAGLGGLSTETDNEPREDDDFSEDSVEESASLKLGKKSSVEHSRRKASNGANENNNNILQNEQNNNSFTNLQSPRTNLQSPLSHNGRTYANEIVDNDDKLESSTAAAQRERQQQSLINDFFPSLMTAENDNSQLDSADLYCYSPSPSLSGSGSATTSAGVGTGAISVKLTDTRSGLARRSAPPEAARRRKTIDARTMKSKNSNNCGLPTTYDSTALLRSNSGNDVVPCTNIDDLSDPDVKSGAVVRGVPGQCSSPRSGVNGEGDGRLSRISGLSNRNLLTPEVPRRQFAGQSTLPVSPDGAERGRISPLFIRKQETFEGVGIGSSSLSHHASHSPFLHHPAFPDARSVRATVKELGLAQDGSLNAYELKILYRHLALADESQKELNSLFHLLDQTKNGRITLDQFLESLPIKPSAHPRNSIAQPRFNESTGYGYSSHLVHANFFSSLKADEPGFASYKQVVEYWETLGITSGASILNVLGFEVADPEQLVDLTELSRALEHELAECSLGSEVLMAALLTYKAELTTLKGSLEQCHLQVAHYSQEIQNVQVRNSLLVEELDQSQLNLEKVAADKVRTVEVKCQAEVRDAEARLKSEREQWLSQLGNLEDTVTQLRSAEELLKSSITKLERENNQLQKEIDSLQEQLKQNQAEADRRSVISGLNSRKRHLTGAGQQNHLEDQLKLWKQRAEIHMDENKMLKDKLDELRSQFESLRRTPVRTGSSGKSGAGHQGHSSSSGYGAGNSGSKRKYHQMGLRPGTALAAFVASRKSAEERRRQQNMARLGRDTSEFESDPEQMYFYGPRIKRRLKLKERRARSANRLYFIASTSDEESRAIETSGLGHEESPVSPKTTSPTPTGGTPRREGRSLDRQLALLESQFSEERKELEHHYRVQLETMEECLGAERVRLKAEVDQEKNSVRDEADRDKNAMLEVFHKEKAELLAAKESELKQIFEKEKRDIEIKWSTEKNVMEREFAEKTMEMMSRLQEDFEAELRRANSRAPSQQQHSPHSGHPASPASSRSVGSTGSGLASSYSSQELADQKKKVLAADKAAEELQVENAKLKEDLVGLKNGYENQIQKRNSQIQIEIEDLKLNYEQKLEDQKESLREEFEARVTNTVQERLAVIERDWSNPDDLPGGLQTAFYDLLDRFKVEARNAHSVELAELTASAQRERSELIRQFQREKEDVARQNMAALNQLAASHDAAVQDLRDSHALDLAESRELISRLGEQKDQTFLEAKNLENTYRTQVAMLEGQFEDLHRLHDAKTVDLISRIETLSAQSHAILSSGESGGEDGAAAGGKRTKIDIIRLQFETELADLNQSKQKLEHELEQQRRDHANELKRLNDRLDTLVLENNQQIEAERANQLSKISHLTDQNDDLSTQIQELTDKLTVVEAEHKLTLSTIQTTPASPTSLKSARDDRTLLLEAQLTDLTLENEKLNDELTEALILSENAQSDAVANSDQLAEENERLSFENENLTSRVAKQQLEIDDLKAELDHRVTPEDFSAQLTAFITANDRLERELEENKSVVDKSNIDIQHLKAQNSELAHNLNNAVEQAKDLTNQVACLQTEASKFESAKLLLEQQLTSSQEECSKLTLQLNDTQRQMQQVQSKLIEKETECNDLTKECDKLKLELRTVQDSSKEITESKVTELVQLKSLVAQYEQDLEAERSNSNNMTKLQSEIGKLHAQIASLAATKSTVESEKVELSLENVQLKALVAQYESDLSNLGEGMNELQNRVDSLTLTGAAVESHNEEVDASSTAIVETGFVSKSSVPLTNNPEHSADQQNITTNSADLRSIISFPSVAGERQPPIGQAASSTDDEVLGPQSCMRCRVLESRVRELVYLGSRQGGSSTNRGENNSGSVIMGVNQSVEGSLATLMGSGGLTGESGIDDDDALSAQDNVDRQDPRLLTKENRRLMRKLQEMEGQMLDLRTCLAVLSSQRIRDQASQLAMNNFDRHSAAPHGTPISPKFLAQLHLASMPSLHSNAFLSSAQTPGVGSHNGVALHSLSSPASTTSSVILNPSNSPRNGEFPAAEQNSLRRGSPRSFSSANDESRGPRLNGALSISAGPDIFRSAGSDDSLHAKVACLEDNNFLLNSRLEENNKLFEQNIEDLKAQMQASVRGSDLAQKLYLENAQLIAELKRREESEEAWQDLRRNLLSLCSELV